jgi:hypothetical protein
MDQRPSIVALRPFQAREPGEVRPVGEPTLQLFRAHFLGFDGCHSLRVEKKHTGVELCNDNVADVKIPFH